MSAPSKSTDFSPKLGFHISVMIGMSAVSLLLFLIFGGR